MGSAGTRVVDPSERVLPPQPASVGEARRAVRELLAAAGRDDLTDTAQLLVSEVVTNALLHAGTDIVLRATLDGTTLRVEVGDGSPHLPVRRRYSATSGTGRGLLMLEQLVDDWGVARQESGKTVWFLLGRGDRDPGLRDDARSDPGPRTAGPTVQVRLHNVPLLLHAAWQEHAEALLREFLLASLDDEGDIDAIEVHAQCTDAIAVVSEHIPRIDVDVPPDRLMAGATEPQVSRGEVGLPVPAASVPHFETLDRTIESSLELSRTGRTLTPPTQPEVQVFRRWLCEEVLGQAVGADPRPWTVEGDQADLVWHQDLDWNPAEVLDAASPRVAADSTNRIVAVSDAALELLGYDEPGQLVGHRLIVLIPERYRQAHVAGFTMYLLTGRRPLLGTEVRVPVVRSGGEELDVWMRVDEEPAGDGSQVFVADLRAV